MFRLYFEQKFHFIFVCLHFKTHIKSKYFYDFHRHSAKLSINHKINIIIVLLKMSLVQFRHQFVYQESCNCHSQLNNHFGQVSVNKQIHGDLAWCGQYIEGILELGFRLDIDVNVSLFEDLFLRCNLYSLHTSHVSLRFVGCKMHSRAYGDLKTATPYMITNLETQNRVG